MWKDQRTEVWYYQRFDEKGECIEDSDWNVLVSELNILKWKSPESQSRANVAMQSLIKRN